MSDGLDALRRYEVVSAGMRYGPKVIAIEPIPVAHPAPAVPCRTATPDETPTSAGRLAKAARDAGWDVKVTYARGTPLQGGELVDSVVLRMRKRHQMAVGAWIGNKFHAGWVWAAAHSASVAEGYVQVGYRDLVKHVKGDGGQLSLGV